jgi:plastocyanin
LKLAIGLLAAAVLVGCGGGEGNAPPSGAVDAQDVVIDRTTAASLSGRILYQGPEPKPVRIDLGADPACAAGNAEPVYSQDLVVSSGGTLGNALVFVKDGLPAGRYPVPRDAVILDQKGCIYHPRVVALMVGQDLEITNSDSTTHNVHPIPRENREWNRSQFAGAEPIRESFGREEVAVPIKCNVHPWMKAWVAVLKHPYFAVTGEDGKFEIGNLPPGEYTIEVWHEKLGTIDRKVTLGASQAGKLEVTLGGA